MPFLQQNASSSPLKRQNKTVSFPAKQIIRLRMMGVENLRFLTPEAYLFGTSRDER
jgi:hypothetical protein